MSDNIFPPWPPQVVARLNVWQVDSGQHPFTCPNRATGHRTTTDFGVLVATRDGWTCPDCDYTQFWAHDYMARPSHWVGGDRRSLVERILRLFARIDSHDSLFWTVEPGSGRLAFSALCNDIFAWATADCEAITEESITELEAAIADIRAVDPEATHWAPELYAARRRHMRPQGAAYPLFHRSIWHLFDACGPERDITFDNPMPRGGMTSHRAEPDPAGTSDGH